MPSLQTIGRKIGDLVRYPGASVTRYNAPTTPAQQGYLVRGVRLSDQDLDTLRKTLFAEISNRTSDKQTMEAHTIINTALNRVPQYKARGKEMSLAQVLSAPNQYQGYGSEEYKRIDTGGTRPSDTQKLGAIDTAISKLKSGNYPDTTAGRVYYHHDPQGRIWLKDGGLYAPQRSVAGLMQ